jgi:hypothetical protein
MYKEVTFLREGHLLLLDMPLGPPRGASKEGHWKVTFAHIIRKVTFARICSLMIRHHAGVVLLSLLVCVFSSPLSCVFLKSN